LGDKISVGEKKGISFWFFLQKKMQNSTDLFLLLGLLIAFGLITPCGETAGGRCK